MSNYEAYIPVDQVQLDALKDYIRNELHVRRFKENEEIASNINWRPTLQIKYNRYTTIAYEINEKVFPPILAVNRTEIVNSHQPICVYSVCPELEYSKHQPEFRRLKDQGFGLLTIDDDGRVDLRAKGIPLAQFISKAKFAELIQGLKGGVKQRIQSAFDAYNHDPINGLEEITKIVEGLAFNVSVKIVSNGYMDQPNARITLANLLAEISNVCTSRGSPLGAQKAAVAGFQSYVQEFRNTAHHEPKSAREANRMLAHCQDGFTEGIRKIYTFVESFKSCGIQVRL